MQNRDHPSQGSWIDRAVSHSRGGGGVVVFFLVLMCWCSVDRAAAQETTPPRASPETETKPASNSLVQRLKQAQEANRQRALATQLEHQAELERQMRSAQRKQEIDAILGGSGIAPSAAKAETVDPKQEAGSGVGRLPTHPVPLITPQIRVPAIPPPARPSTPPAKPVRTHVIAEGETFSKLAIKYYGDDNKWTAIGQANPMIDPTKLKIGQVIRVPELADHVARRRANAERVGEAVGQGGGGGAPPPPDRVETTGVRRITTQGGDTLSELSVRVYGTSKSWKAIYDANRDKIKTPDRVPVGVELVIPEVD